MANEPTDDTPSVLAAARQARRSAIQSIRANRHEPREHRETRTLQQSHNDSLLLDQAAFRRCNRIEQEQAEDENMDNPERRSRSSSSSGQYQRRNGSSEQLNSSIFHQTLEEVIKGTPKRPAPDPGAPADIPMIDFSDYLPLLEGTESQGLSDRELIAATPNDFVAMVDGNRQFWFDLLSRIPPFITDNLDKRNRDLRRYKDDNQRLRTERDNLKKSKGKQTADGAFLTLQEEYEGFKHQAEAALEDRNQQLEELTNDLWNKDDENKLLDQELDQIAAERDQARADLERERATAATLQSQTQEHRNIFARPIFVRPGLPSSRTTERTSEHSTSHNHRSRSHSRQAEERQTPGAQSSSSSVAKLDPRWPNPDMFSGDNTKYRVWRSKMQAKLRASYGVGTETDVDITTVLDFVHSRTEGQAWQIIDNHTSNLARNPWTSLTELWDELDSNYMSRDEEAKADMLFMMNRQVEGESYQKWMITLRDLAARSGRTLKANEVWMKLNNIYQKKTIPYRFGDFATMHDFCVNEEEAFEAMKTLRPKNTNTNDGVTGRSRGRGRGDDASGSGSSRPSARTSRSEVARYLPRKYENMPKARDPDEAERIRKNNLCFSCRQPGHGAGAPQCPFNMARGRYAFADIPREMTKAQYDTFIQGRANTHLAIQQFEDANELPEPEEPQLRIQSTGHHQGQGNGQLHQ